MTKDEQSKVKEFRDAVERFLTSASNPGRAAAVIDDNTPGSPYDDLVRAKIEVDAMLWEIPERVQLVKCPACAAFFLEYKPKCTACGAENLRSAQWSKEAIQEFEHRHAPPLEITKITVSTL
jgi:hypothetical protein